MIVIYICCIYACLIVSSPYLLVFSDDRVCGTCEQMMLQVDLVRLSSGAEASLGKEFIRVLCFMVFE